ncbi:MAG: ATPase [Thermoanaerobacterales bacterium]|nr:ATPase [Bacillota bacterium]MDI6907317.1 ATPase [Thermoanaerobacterales bacterium]
MELLSVLNELEEFIQSCSRVPMTKKVLVDEEKVLDFLDRIRTLLPDEVRKAKWVVQEREKVLAESRQEAERLLEEARKEITRQAEESEIVREAKEMADDLLKKAEQMAREMRLGARDYADDILAKLESRLDRLLKEVEAGRNELKAMQ